MNSTELGKIAAGCSTPLYIFDLDEFDERIGRIEKALDGRAGLCFAMKANPFLIRAADRLVKRFEVCSPGEFDLCERAGIAPEKIVYSGVYKDPGSTKRVIRRIAGSGVATAESVGQLTLLNECADAAGRAADVILRITGGNQFGIDEETARFVIRNRSDYPHLRIRGFQMYTGTQKKKLRTIEKELAKLDSLITLCGTEYGFRTEELEYGPGLPVNYFEDDAFDEEGMLADFRGLLDNMNYRGRIFIEAGRFAAASCGYYLTSAVDIKKNQGQNIIITDGGSHQLKYYGQNMGMRIPFHEVIRPEENGALPRDPAPEAWSLYGALCTVHDVIVRDLPLTSPATGDLFVFRNAGAYSVTEGMALFLSRDIPPVLSYRKDEGAKVMRKRVQASELNRIDL